MKINYGNWVLRLCAMTVLFFATIGIIKVLIDTQPLQAPEAMVGTGALIGGLVSLLAFIVVEEGVLRKEAHVLVKAVTTMIPVFAAAAYYLF